jgi:hypothetical protein
MSAIISMRRLASTHDYYSYSGDTIEIHVEDNKFHIPKKLICRTSEFFKNAAKPEWTREAQPLVLPEETARIFGLYTIWLYNGTIERAESDLKTWEPLSQAYIMGERFMDPHFQAVILEAMAHRADAGKKPNIMTINDIYHGTTESSPAGSFMVAICVWDNRSCLRNVQNPALDLHEDLVNDLLETLMALPTSAERSDTRAKATKPYRSLLQNGT